MGQSEPVLESDNPGFECWLLQLRTWEILGRLLISLYFEPWCSHLSSRDINTCLKGCLWLQAPEAQLKVSEMQRNLLGGYWVSSLNKRPRKSSMAIGLWKTGSRIDASTELFLHLLCRAWNKCEVLHLIGPVTGMRPKRFSWSQCPKFQGKNRLVLLGWCGCPWVNSDHRRWGWGGGVLRKRLWGRKYHNYSSRVAMRIKSP